MDYTKFSGTYTVRRLFSDDIPSIFALCEKNPQYYEHCPPFVTPEKIEADHHINDYTVVVMNRFLTKA